MKVYIQSDKHHVPLDRDFFIAYCGFMEMGAEIIFFYTPEELRESYPEDVVVGYVGTVTHVFTSSELRFLTLITQKNCQRILVEMSGIPLSIPSTRIPNFGRSS